MGQSASERHHKQSGEERKREWQGREREKEEEEHKQEKEREGKKEANDLVPKLIICSMQTLECANPCFSVCLFSNMLLSKCI